MTKIYSIHGTLRTWKDPQGKIHKQRIECGAIYQSSSGSLVVRIEALPVSKDFDGWLATVPVAPVMPPGRRCSPGMPPAPPPPNPNEPNPDHDKPF